jgi:hypothetical protein
LARPSHFNLAVAAVTLLINKALPAAMRKPWYARSTALDDWHLEYVLSTYMKVKPRRKLTITVEDSVYRGLHKFVGRRNISRFLNDLARPHVVRDRLEEGYRAMAADEAREAEAAEWIEGLVGDVADEPR